MNGEEKKVKESNGESRKVEESYGKRQKQRKQPFSVSFRFFPFLSVPFGFTLIELLVVILIVGILAAIGYPSYIRSMETSKANDAVGYLTMAGNADRMYAVDHNGIYVAAGQITDSCDNGATCPQNNACDLVYCGYMPADNYSEKPYSITINAYAPPPSALVTVQRCTGSSPCTNSSPYTGWGYNIDANGNVTPFGNQTPPPPQ